MANSRNTKGGVFAIVANCEGDYRLPDMWKEAIRTVGATRTRPRCPSRSCCCTARTCSAPTCASPTSAAATPRPRSTETDPLTGEPVDGAVGQGIGRRPRQHEAGWLRHALSGQAARAEERCTAASPTRTRWSATSRTAPSTSIRAPPASTRRRTASSRTHVDHMHADAIIAIAAAQNGEALTAEDLRRRDRLAALAAAGLRARPEAARAMAQANPGSRA